MKEKNERKTIRTLSMQQIYDMTLPDLFLVLDRCRMIDDPDWAYLMALSLMRASHTVIDYNGINFDSILEDVSR